LEERIREEEEITKDSPIITPKLRMKLFIRAVNIGDIIRGAIRGAGFPWRPYVLRSYFDTQLMLAESKGLVLRDYRKFWMGHKGDIENRYTANKARLPESVIENMREAYKRSHDYLQTTKPETTEEKLKEAFRKQLLLVAGFNERARHQQTDSHSQNRQLKRVQPQTQQKLSASYPATMSKCGQLFCQQKQLAAVLQQNKGINFIRTFHFSLANKRRKTSRSLPAISR